MGRQAESESTKPVRHSWKVDSSRLKTTVLLNYGMIVNKSETALPSRKALLHSTQTISEIVSGARDGCALPDDKSKRASLSNEWKSEITEQGVTSGGPGIRWQCIQNMLTLNHTQSKLFNPFNTKTAGKMRFGQIGTSELSTDSFYRLKLNPSTQKSFITLQEMT